MSLHLRLFLLLTLLLTLTLAGAMWGLKLLTRDLSDAVDDTVVHVGRAVAQIFEHHLPSPPPATPPPSAGAPQGGVQASEQIHRIMIRRVDREVREDATAKIEPGAEEAPVRVLRFELEGPAGDLRLEGTGLSGQRIKVPRDSFQAALTHYTGNLWLGALLLLALLLPLAWWLARRIAGPLKALAQAAQAVGSGAFGQTAVVAGPPEVQAAIGTFNRMSRQLQSLEAERQRLADLAQLGELGEVGRGLAHGLRNPLNTIALSLDALADGTPGPASDTLRQNAREQIRRIDEALKGFLALAAGGSARGEIMDLRVLLEDLWCEASQRSAGRVQILSSMPDAPLPCRVLVPELRAALQAPLVNALEASPDGASIELALSPGPAPGRVCLQIGDRGPGLAPEFRARLFTAHQSTKADGAGMGLFLAARILKDRYDGSIRLDDRPGGGTLVHIEFGERRDG